MSSDKSESSPEPAVASDWGYQLFPGDATGPIDTSLPAPTCSSAITHPFESEADWKLAQFMAKHDNMPKGMLDELLGIFATGGLTFRNTYELYKTVDVLPGVEFVPSTIQLDPLPGVAWVPAHGPRLEYVVFARSLLDLVKDCLCDKATSFLNPLLVEPDTKPEHITEAPQYQRLLRLLRTVTRLDDAVLVPLVFHSGM